MWIILFALKRPYTFVVAALLQLLMTPFVLMRTPTDIFPVAQLIAISQNVLKQLPPGATPPLIIQYDASTVPILQFGISSDKLSEQQVFDATLNQIRVGLITVPGV